MPITVHCPGCSSKLNAPDTAAGKRVKCPKCAKLLTVPADEVVEDFDVVDDDEEFEVVEPKAAKKRALVEEDDDEEDERPREKKGKKPPPKSKTPMLIGGAVLVLLLAVGGYFALAGGKKGSAGAAGASGAWTKFDAPDGSFTVTAPGSPTSPDTLQQAEMIGMNRDDAAKVVEATKAMGIVPETWMFTAGNRYYTVTMVKAAKTVANAGAMESMLQGGNKSEISKHGLLSGEETISMAGRSTNWFRVKTNNGKTYLSTFFILGDRMYDISVIDDVEFTTADENFKKFIDSFSHTRSADNPAPEKPTRGRR